jgi:hypothetical protein
MTKFSEPRNYSFLAFKTVFKTRQNSLKKVFQKSKKIEPNNGHLHMN